MANLFMFKKLLLLIFFIAATSVVYADHTDQIKVNLIVFTHINQHNLASTTGGNELIQPSANNLVKLISSDTTTDNVNQYGVHTMTSQYQLLPEKSVGMRSIVHHLNKNNDQVILDLAWTQPAEETNQWVHVYGGKAYDQDGQPLQMNTDTMHTVPQNLQAHYWQINGFVRISHNHDYNVSARLYLTHPHSLGNVDARQFHLAPLTTYLLTGYRRMQLNQIAYFDHPLFGALVSIKPDHSKQ